MICPSGKVGHHSEASAKKAATAVGTKRTHTRPRVYQCDLCGGQWHMTSAPKLRLPAVRRTPLQPPQVATRAELDVWMATCRPARTTPETNEGARDE